MPRTVGIGKQDFEKIIAEDCFYVDKTGFIKEWWENKDEVTLITRPRRFGKTLNMSMLEKFFSVRYAGRGDLFEGLAIWTEEKYRRLQGTYPVIFLSFADVKETNFKDTREKICQLISMLYEEFRFLLDGDLLSGKEKDFFDSVSAKMETYAATLSLKIKPDRTGERRRSRGSDLSERAGGQREKKPGRESSSCGWGLNETVFTVQ